MTIEDWSHGASHRGYAIELRLDSRSGVPPYLQLVQQVEHAMRLGYLSEGDQLPTVKDAVERLAINPNTVMKAYRELEHRGLAAARPGQGTFILPVRPGPGLAGLRELRGQLVAWLRSATSAGLDGTGIEALVSLTLQEFLASPAVSEQRDQEPTPAPESA